jgi:hypothetical protein
MEKLNAKCPMLVSLFVSELAELTEHESAQLQQEVIRLVAEVDSRAAEFYQDVENSACKVTIKSNAGTTATVKGINYVERE